VKVYKQRRVLVEIGPLDTHVILGGMNRRREAGLNTTCDACGRAIDGDRFAGGFLAGHANLILHVECVPDGTTLTTLR